MYNYCYIIEEEITSGEIKVKLNYGKIPIVDESLDLCDLITQISQQCPVKKGDFKVEITETLPAYIPSVGTLITKCFICINYRENTLATLL